MVFYTIKDKEFIEPKNYYRFLVAYQGKLVKSCTDDTPISGMYLFVYNDMPGSNLIKNCNQTEKGTTTDENGEFSITYSESDVCGSEPYIYIGYSNDPRAPNNALMTGFPGYVKGGKEYNVTVLKENYVTFYHKIKTSKTYTEQDTLFYYDAKSSDYKYINGPFTDGMAFDSFTNNNVPMYLDDPNAGFSSSVIGGKFYIHAQDTLIGLRSNFLKTYKVCGVPNYYIFELP